MYSNAPLFEAFDVAGQKISLQQLLNKGPVVVCFYRGQWCPYCNRHMSNLQDSLSFITSLGASLIAITPEKNEEISKTISKSGATFSIIYDYGHKIMDAYKVSFKVDAWKNLLHFAEGVNINKASGNDDNVLPVPATYIIATDGSIVGRHFDTDYTQRMPVKAILEVLKTIVATKK
jgi:peroxiredoxin